MPLYWDHAVVYHKNMILLDLDNLDSNYAKFRPWAMEWLGLISFRRKDYLPDDITSVKEALVRTVESETGVLPKGRVFFLLFRYRR